MKTKLMIAGLLAAATLAMGQKVKSPKEAEAVNAVFTAPTPDQQIAAADNVIRNFKDTEFKPIVLLVAAQAAQQKGDGLTAIQYGTRTLEADPKNYQAMLLVSGLLAQGTREFDLDKDEKLGRATKMANEAITTMNSATKPNPQLADEKWADIKKDMIAQAHDTLGIIAMVQKKWDPAIAEFKTSVESAATPDATSSLRLASAYLGAARYDEAIAVFDKVLAMPGVNDQFKKVATAEKQRAEKLKAAKQ